MFIHSQVAVSRKELTAFRMAPDIMKGMRALKARDGIPVAVQVDRAVRAYLKTKSVKTETGPKPARAGKRSK